VRVAHHPPQFGRKPLPASVELLEKKREAQKIMHEAFAKINALGLSVVCFDAKWNELMDSGSVSFITREEWEHGVWNA
jgi:hypothetical protein